MKLLFLGTGAADGMNMAFSGFSDKNRRRCSAVLIDGHILIDCGPHILNSLEAAKVDAACITDIVFTHLHGDHYNRDNIERIAAAGKRKLNLWFREDAEVPEFDNCELHPMTLYKAYSTDGYTLTGVLANHEMYPQNISVEKDGKKLFYGTDGAWLMGDTVRYMKDKLYDSVILDCTVGDYAGDYRMGEHNSLPMIRLMKESMKTLKITNEKTGFYITHLAMCLHKSHDETAKICEKDGITVAYDGLEIDI